MSIVRFQKIFIPTALHKSLEILKVERSQRSNVKGKYQVNWNLKRGGGRKLKPKTFTWGG